MIILILLFSFFIIFFATETLNLPISAGLNIVCLFKFEISTLSKSTIPIFPTPEAARYVNKGHPKPPKPTIKTLKKKFSFVLLHQFFLKLFVFQTF